MMSIERARELIAQGNGPTDLSDDDVVQMVAFMTFLADRVLTNAPAAALEPQRMAS